jgi:hypothetical protein
MIDRLSTTPSQFHPIVLPISLNVVRRRPSILSSGQSKFSGRWGLAGRLKGPAVN